MLRLTTRSIRFAALALLFAAGTAHAQWTVSGSDIYYNSGNVGIWTSGPAYHLHVVENSNTDGSRAIYGLASATSGVVNGVYGHTTSSVGRGVIGLASATSGANFGLYGHSSSSEGRGVFGLAQATSGQNFGVYGRSISSSGTGVFGEVTATTGFTAGVYGNVASSSGKGVLGVNSAATGSAAAVQGEAISTSGIGVAGFALASSGSTAGVYGFSNSSSGFGVFSDGNFAASGSKSFCIDHPLDPANKYLLHYSIESSEVLNSYSGTVQLDPAGSAVIVLPSYFGAVNADPRYTLTAIGASMPHLHIAEEINPAALQQGARARPGAAIPICSFRVSGGAPGAKVSWRVEALRNDRWMQSRSAPVEVEKPVSERGTYLRPELFGQPQKAALFSR